MMKYSVFLKHFAVFLKLYIKFKKKLKREYGSTPLILLTPFLQKS